METLLRLVSLRQVRAEPLRSAVMVLGIALGVAVFVGVQALNETTLAGFGALTRAGAGQADLILEGGGGGLDPAITKIVRACPEVASAAGLLMEAARPVERKGQAPRRYMVLGLELGSPTALAAYGGAPDSQARGESPPITIARPDALAMQPNVILVSRAMAKRDGLKPGDSLFLFTSVGKRRVMIAGDYDGDVLAPGLGPDVLIMALPSAQLVFSRGARIDRVVIRLARDTAIQPGRAAIDRALAAALPAAKRDGLRLREPGQGRARASELLGSLRVGLSMASLLALLIGQFLIYNTMAMAVVRRRPEIGILRALGATRRQLALLWLAEALVYGLLGAVVGIGLGLLLARLGMSAFAANVSQLYESVDLSVLRFGPLTILLGLISGPVATLLAALPPVLEALNIAPVEAARKDLPPPDPRPMVRRLALAGLALLTVGLIATVATRSGVGIVGGGILQGLLTLGFALCAPWGLLFMTRLARPLMGRILGPPGVLAGDNLVRSPVRSGITVAALMIAVGGVLAISSLVVSLRGAVDSWLDGVLSADLYVTASSALGTPDSTLMERGIEAELEAFPEVKEVNGMRFLFADVEDHPVALLAIEEKNFGRRSQLPITAGEEARGRELMRSGKGIVASANYLLVRGKSLGDTIKLRTPTGVHELEIGLVVVDYTSEHGTLFIDRHVFDRFYEDTRVNTYNLWFEEGLDPGARDRVAERIRATVGARFDLYVLSADSFRDSILKTVEDSFKVTLAMQLVAISIALLGVINTLFAAVLERTREIGVLRAIGASRGHIRRAVAGEAVLLGALSGGFGITCGLTLGYVLVVNVTTGAFGWQVPWEMPIAEALAGAVVAAVLSGVAGLVPAERAARVQIVDALIYE